eukprot:7252751-Pyramimonas_sp.AAC.2
MGEFSRIVETGVLRNPVCNIATMVGATDIPDWCYVEAFGKGCAPYNSVPTPADLERMFEVSPAYHIDKVQYS